MDVATNQASPAPPWRCPKRSSFGSLGWCGARGERPRVKRGGALCAIHSVQVKGCGESVQSSGIIPQGQLELVLFVKDLLGLRSVWATESSQSRVPGFPELRRRQRWPSSESLTVWTPRSLIHWQVQVLTQRLTENPSWLGSFFHPVSGRLDRTNRCVVGNEAP